MEGQATSRVCACLDCRDFEADKETGRLGDVIYGNACASCAFYKAFDKTEAAGVCCKLELKPGQGGMNLYHRARGALRGIPLVVGACFSCNSFLPVHEVPDPETFWKRNDRHSYES